MLPSSRPDGINVVYLLRTAYRARANPALEVALHAAAALDLPLICIAVLEDSFPQCMRTDAMAPARAPTDRMAHFQLEALRELQPAFAARGTMLYVHVQRDGSRQQVAMSHAAKAAFARSASSMCLCRERETVA